MIAERGAPLASSATHLADDVPPTSVLAIFVHRQNRLASLVTSALRDLLMGPLVEIS